jgi:DNA-directed RNA polymerase specialized sigma24 family protein
VDLSGANLQLDLFEELATPLLDQLYNFAHWLTQNRDDAEDLVQETYLKALKGFSSFQLELISGHGSIASCATRS